MIDDAELLRSYAEEKSEGAFAELVRRHVNFVYASALRRVGGDAHFAEDVTQWVFTTLAREAAGLARREVLSGWLYVTTRNAAAQTVRGERRRVAREQEAHSMNELTAASAHDTEWKRLRPVIDGAMDALRDDDREAVLLRFFEGKTFGEIAVKLRLTENAARMRVERALDTLQMKLARRGITSTTAALGVAMSGQVGVAAPAGLAASVAAGALVAGVSSAGLGMAGILTSMSTLKTAVSMGVAVVAIGFGVYEVQQRSRADAAAATSQDEREQLQAQLNAMRKIITRSEQRAVRAEEHLGALERKTRGLFSNQMSPGLTPVSGAGLGAMFEPRLSLFTPLPADPEEARQQVRNLNRPGVRMTYSPFYQKRGFTPEERTRFEELALDNTERGSALFKKAAAQSATQDRESLQTLAEVVNDQNHATLGALVRDAFGDKAGEEFQRFQETLPLRPITNQLASALFYTETPLTVAQAEQLVDIMAQSARSANGKVNPAEMDKPAVLSAASAVLSAPQIEALSGFLDQTIRRGATRR